MQTVPTTDPAQELLRWRSHPARHAGGRFAVAIAFVLIVPIGLWILYSVYYALLGLVILVGSLSSFFLPTDYVLYVGGLESRFLGICRRFTWEQFRSSYPDRYGVLLSPFPGPSRLENFRGLYLRFNGHREAVLRVVTERVRHDTPAAGGQP